jgi:hypothetical protein
VSIESYIFWANCQLLLKDEKFHVLIGSND